MANEVRIVAATEDMAAVVDKGLDVDTKIKSLTLEDKEIKNKINVFVDGIIEKDEKSLKVVGTLAAALVSAAEKCDLDSSSKSYPELKKAVDRGLLADVIEKSRVLVIPPDDILKAAEVLKKAGINALVSETLTLDTKAFKELPKQKSASEDHEKARKVLVACVKKDVTYRVKYEKV